MVDRADGGQRVIGVVDVAERPEGDLGIVVHSQSASTTMISFDSDSRPAPQTAFITFCACFGKRFSIDTITQLWKTPASGRSKSTISGTVI